MNIFEKIKRFYPIFFIIGIWVLFSLPFLLFNKTPYPANYQVNFFSPWAAYPEMKGPVKNAAQPDIVTQIYPWRYFSINEMKAGRIPLWNPYSFAGTPHLANYQSAALSPLNTLFFLPIKFIDAWSILVLLQPLMAGLFTYILMRKMKVGKLGSLLSSISFMFCGFLVTWLGYATLGYAILPLPFAIYCVLQFADAQKYRWLIFLSLTFPLSYFAGHFQTSLYFAIGVIAFIIYNLIFSNKKKPYFESFVFIFAGLLFTAPQVLPTIELYMHSVRSELFQKVEAIPLNYLVTLFSPDFYGNPVTRNDWYGHYAEWNGYAGAIALALGCYAMFFERNKKTIFFIVLALVSFLMAFDTPFQSLLVALKIPVISTSAASRIIVLFSFSVAVLAGFGFDSLLRRKNKKRFLMWVAIVFGIFFATSAIGFLSITDAEKINIAWKNSVLPAAILLLLTFILYFLVFLKNKKKSLILVATIVILSGFEMYRFASKWQNFDPKELVFVDVPVTAFYNSQNHYDRALGLSGGEDAVYYKMPILSGYDPLFKAEYGELIQFIGKGKPAAPERSVVVFPLNGKFTPQALNLLGVHYIVHKTSDGTFSWAFPFNKYPAEQFTKIYDDPYYKVFKNRTAYERAFVVSSVQKIDSSKIPEKMFESNLKEVAFVEEEINGSSKLSQGTARIIEYNPNKVSIKAVTKGDAFLVLTDNYYPGWKATVNGKNAKIYKANYSFRGVFVPKGESNVIFTYVPLSFYIGIYFFLLGGLVIIVFACIKYFGGKK